MNNNVLRKKEGKTVAKDYELGFRDVAQINSALSDQTDVSAAGPLLCNTKPQRCFNGQMLGHQGFLLTGEQRDEIIKRDPRSAEIIHPYLNGMEVLTLGGEGERFVLNFEQTDQLTAAGYMRPHHKAFLSRWWQLGFGRPEMLSVIKPLPRYLACAYVTKRPVFLFISREFRPNNLIQVFGFADDYSFGVLQSHAHWLWFVTKCGKLKSDFRYSAESVFDTFPWPQSRDAKAVNAVAAAGRKVRRIRAETLPQMKGGLRALYRTLEFPGANPRKAAHAALDAAVLAAYGFNAKADLLAQLLALNQQVAAHIAAQESVTAPGIPPGFPNAESLVTDDCIRPAAG